MITDLAFWDRVAEIYDTFGVPRDLIRIKLREACVSFTDDEFNTLLNYMVGCRNRSVEKIDVTTILIKLPDNWDRDKMLELLSV